MHGLWKLLFPTNTSNISISSVKQTISWKTLRPLTVQLQGKNIIPSRKIAMIGNRPLKDSERIGKARRHANRNPATMRLGLQDLKKESTQKCIVIFLRFWLTNANGWINALDVDRPVTTGQSVLRLLQLLCLLELIEKEAPVKLDTKPPKSRNRDELKLLLGGSLSQSLAR